MKKFLTEYDGPDGKYGDEVDAIDWQHAEQIAAARTPPQTVIGEHKLTIIAEGMTPADADRLLRELAEQDEWERRLDQDAAP